MGVNRAIIRHWSRHLFENLEREKNSAERRLRVFRYPFHGATTNEVLKVQDAEIDVSKIFEACLGFPRSGFESGAQRRVIFSENHDLSSNQAHNGVYGRIPRQVDSDGSHKYWAQKKAMLLIGLVMTCCGSPMLLMEQELLSYANFSFPTPPKFDWAAVDTSSGMLRETKDLIALRTNKRGYSHGLVGGRCVASYTWAFSQ